MASNDYWPLLSSRPNNNAKHAKDNKLKQLTEMFSSTLDDGVIISVLEDSQWNVDAALEILITLSASSEHSTNNAQTTEVNLLTTDEISLQSKSSNSSDEFPPMNEEELRQQREEFEKFENCKQESQKIETESLCGLKVQYRPRGMDVTSEIDSDADVVIEDETEDYEIQGGSVKTDFLSMPPQWPSWPSAPVSRKYAETPSPIASPTKFRSDSPLCQVEDDIQKGYKVLILMRGLPGSGKSYLAKQIVLSTVGGDHSQFIFCADNYLMNRGVYCYDPSKLQDAHNINKLNVLSAMNEGRSPIIVDNTNTQVWEMHQYVVMAVKHGYIITVIEPNTAWSKNIKELTRRNEHGVPKEKIKQMMDRFENNISGEKLIKIYGLNYTAENQPPQLRNYPPLDKQHETEELINSEALNMIAKEYESMRLSDEKEVKPVKEMKPNNDVGVEDSPSHHGAIGSERKNSTCHLERPNIETLVYSDNVLSQCWDFTLLLKEKQIHSTNSLVSIEGPKTWIREQKNKQLEELSNRMFVNNGKTTFVMNTDDTEAFDKLQTNFHIPTEMEENSPTSESSSGEKSSDIDMSQYDVCYSPSLNVKEENEEKAGPNKSEEPTARLGNIFSFFKKSFLPNEVKSGDPANSPGDYRSTDDLTDKLRKVRNTDLILEANIHDPLLGDQLTEKLANSSAQFLNSLQRKAHDVIEHVNNFETIVGTPKDDDVSKALLEASSDFQIITPLDFTDRKSSESSSSSESLLNNVNLISWKESPFPVEETVAINRDQVDVIETSDASTNTDMYDFNVLYMGGNCDPEFKVMIAHNRSINPNSPFSASPVQPPPHKLMLDKSSMAGEIVFFEESNFESKTDRTEELAKMFPHIRKNDLMEVYKGLCKSDYHWAVEYLQNAGDELTRNASSDSAEIFSTEQNAEKSNSLHETKDLLFQSKPQRTEAVKKVMNNRPDSQSQLESIWSFGKLSDEFTDLKPLPQRTKKNKKFTEQNLALQKELEEKLSFCESTYHPHILQVKRWKSREFNPIVESPTKREMIEFADSPPRFDASPEIEEKFSSEEDESSLENDVNCEEMMELNLGFDFIKTLESTFGVQDYQTPDGLFPVVQIRKSMAQQLYNLWVESVETQLAAQQEQLDQMISIDAEYARSLEEEEARAITEQKEPNLSEVMDMELAFAIYNNDLKKQKKETPMDMAARLTWQTLNEMFPDCDPDMLDEIYQAHNRNFKETVTVIEASTGASVDNSDVSKKCKGLIDKVKKESVDQSLRESTSRGDVIHISDENVEYSYADALDATYAARKEASRQLNLRNENFEKASKCHRSGSYAVAAYYSQMAKLHAKNVEIENAKAASAILASQAHVNGESTLDLHNLYVAEALRALDIFLEYQLEKLARGTDKAAKVHIITGWGARSINGRGRIKPAVTNVLNNKGIKFYEENVGCLQVTLFRWNIPKK